MNDFDGETVWILMTISGNTKVGRLVSILEDRTRFHDDYDKLEKWSEIKKMWFNKEKMQKVTAW